MEKITNASRPKKRVLLALLPFWTPAIPPLGISCLKSYLQEHQYHVTAIDANMESTFRDIYDRYFEEVNRYIPKNKKGNFFNMGMEVMRNHLMAHAHYVSEVEYIELVKLLFYSTFYSALTTPHVKELNGILDEFYWRLKEYIIDQVQRIAPDVLGLSVFSGSLPASMYAFRVVKEKFPHITTVMGGGTFAMELGEGTPNYDYFLEKTPYIDKIIIGEGENTLLRYLEGELDDAQRVYSLRNNRQDTVDINKIGIPDFSDFDLQNYPQLGSYTCRSCPYQCSFCSETVHWGVYRKKTPEKIVDELIALYNAHGSQLFMMGDSLLNIVVDGVANEFIKRDVTLYWDGYLRADPPVCDVENTMRWRRGGLYRARLGVESGSQKVLDIMNKKISPQQIKDAVRSLAHAGIKTTTYWICGHPGETEEDFQQTLDLIEELKDDLYEAECNPFKYYLTGQVDSEKWMSEYKRVTLYPESAKEMLITQTWILQDCEPLHEEIYRRVDRFVEHCNRLGIPNPYFIHEIIKADERWKRLHKNAVPPLREFKINDAYISESKTLKDLVPVSPVKIEEGDFNF